MKTKLITLIDSWIQQEMRMRSEIENSRVTGTFSDGKQFKANQLNICRRALQLTIGEVIEPKKS